MTWHAVRGTVSRSCCAPGAADVWRLRRRLVWRRHVPHADSANAFFFSSAAALGTLRCRGYGRLSRRCCAAGWTYCRSAMWLWFKDLQVMHLFASMGLASALRFCNPWASGKRCGCHPGDLTLLPLAVSGLPGCSRCGCGTSRFACGCLWRIREYCSSCLFTVCVPGTYVHVGVC